MNSRFATCRLFRTTLLISALLLAQLVLTLHHAELARHGTAGTCEFCLTQADLTDSTISASLPPPVVPTGIYQPATLPVAYPTPHHEHYSARAPPLPVI